MTRPPVGDYRVGAALSLSLAGGGLVIACGLGILLHVVAHRLGVGPTGYLPYLIPIAGPSLLLGLHFGGQLLGGPGVRITDDGIHIKRGGLRRILGMSPEPTFVGWSDVLAARANARGTLRLRVRDTAKPRIPLLQRLLHGESEVAVYFGGLERSARSAPDAIVRWCEERELKSVRDDAMALRASPPSQTG